jgi:hypothetical protein
MDIEESLEGRSEVDVYVKIFVACDLFLVKEPAEKV